MELVAGQACKRRPARGQWSQLPGGLGQCQGPPRSDWPIAPLQFFHGLRSPPTSSTDRQGSDRSDSSFNGSQQAAGARVGPAGTQLDGRHGADWHKLGSAHPPEPALSPVPQLSQPGPARTSHHHRELSAGRCREHTSRHGQLTSGLCPLAPAGVGRAGPGSEQEHPAWGQGVQVSELLHIVLGGSWAGPGRRGSRSPGAMSRRAPGRGVCRCPQGQAGAQPPARGAPHGYRKPGKASCSSRMVATTRPAQSSSSGHTGKLPVGEKDTAQGGNQPPGGKSQKGGEGPRKRDPLSLGREGGINPQ